MTSRSPNPRIEFSTLFNKQLKESPRHIKIAFRQAFELFLEDSQHSQLRNHPLTKEYAGYNSIDVTKDWRAIFMVRKSRTTTVVVFQAIGTHSKLYKK